MLNKHLVFRYNSSLTLSGKILGDVREDSIDVVVFDFWDNDNETDLEFIALIEGVEMSIGGYVEIAP